MYAWYPGVKIEIKYYPWDFSPILNVIVTQLSLDITGRIRGDLGGVTKGSVNVVTQ